MTDSDPQEQLFQKFRRIEDKENLFAKTIQGVHFWPRVRSKIYNQILYDENTNLTSQISLSDYPSYLYRALSRSVINSPYTVDPSDLIFWGQDRRQKGQDGAWWDIHCDPIIDELNHTYSYFELSHDNTYSGEARTDSIRYLDSPNMLGAFLSKVSIFRISLTENEKQILYEVDLAFRDIGFDGSVKNTVIEDLSYRRVLFPIYKYILSRSRPDAIILVSINPAKQTMLEAAKYLNVPVIELQHGMISKSYLRLRDTGNEIHQSMVPDYLFTWGKYWNESIDYIIKDQDVIAVGYPYLEIMKERYNTIKSENLILVVSQPSFSDELFEFSNIVAKQMEDWNVVFKLHPKEYSSWSNSSSDVKIIKDQISLYELLARAQIQIGVSSTVLFEGAYFDLDTYILDIANNSSIDYLVESDIAKYVSNPTEFIDKLSVSNKEKKALNKNIFKPNPMQNTLQQIDRIIDN